MNKRVIMTLIVIAAASLAAVLAMGCGEDTPTIETPDVGEFQVPTGSGEEHELQKKLDELKTQEMTVEFIEDGETVAIWSQDGKGSWRSDDPEDEDVYTIYNADEDKLWSVNGDNATELDSELGASFEEGNPLSALSAFAYLSFLPRTGGSDDVWEWDVPGSGSLRIEFKGPDGLISKVITEDPSTGTSEMEFKYSDVGNVDDSMFELADDIAVEKMESARTGTRSSSSDTGEE